MLSTKIRKIFGQCEKGLSYVAYHINDDDQPELFFRDSEENDKNTIDSGFGDVLELGQLILKIVDDGTRDDVVISEEEMTFEEYQGMFF